MAQRGPGRCCSTCLTVSYSGNRANKKMADIRNTRHFRFLAVTNCNSSASTRYSRNFGKPRMRSRSGASCKIFPFFLLPELFRWTLPAYFNHHYKSMDRISTLMARILAAEAPWIRDRMNTLFCLTGLWQVPGSGPCHALESGPSDTLESGPREALESGP